MSTCGNWRFASGGEVWAWVMSAQLWDHWTDRCSIVVGWIDIGLLKRRNRPRPDGLQTVVVQDGVEIVRITLGNYHVEPQSRKARLWLIVKKIWLDSNKTGGDTFWSLPFRQPPAGCSVQRQYTGGVQRQSTTDVRIQKCCVHIIPHILTTDRWTGGIQNWGHYRAVKTNRLVFFSVSELMLLFFGSLLAFYFRACHVVAVCPTTLINDYEWMNEWTENTGRRKLPKNRHLGTIAQLCWAVSSQLKHVSTIGKKAC